MEKPELLVPLKGGLTLLVTLPEPDMLHFATIRTPKILPLKKDPLEATLSITMANPANCSIELSGQVAILQAGHAALYLLPSACLGQVQAFLDGVKTQARIAS